MPASDAMSLKRSPSTVLSSPERSSAEENPPSRQFKDLSKEDQQAIAKISRPYMPSPYSDERRSQVKRKREEERSQSEEEEQKASKQRRLWDGIEQEIDVEQSDLVNHWINNGFDWSGRLRETTMMEPGRSSQYRKKRSLSRSTSYRQSTQSGDTPRAWGGKHAEAMLERGIYMEKQENAEISDTDSQLCKTILEASYDLPQEWRFQKDNISTILKLAIYKNERRVMRDVGPHIMPSPELLSAQGRPGLEHIAEGIDAQWTKCTSLCGPKTKPDGSHGISRFVFDQQERERLTANNTCACESMVFPFYICEAKCFDKSIEESELQALHGASVAGNAMIELYQKIDAAEELHQRILTFSVSHNQRLVKIYAHFASVDGSKVTFHRHRLFETDLMNEEALRNKPYQIALAIWQHFFPIHLDRVRKALARQQNRAMDSFTAQLGLDDESRSGLCTPSSSQEDNPDVAMLQHENARLLTAMLAQQEHSREQMEQQIQDSRDQRKLLERQQERLEARLREQQQEARKQQEKLETRLREQQEEAQEHREKLETRLNEQQEEIMAYLKQSISSRQSK